jgi:hypothetical protein
VWAKPTSWQSHDVVALRPSDNCVGEAHIIKFENALIKNNTTIFLYFLILDFGKTKFIQFSGLHFTKYK